MYIARGILAYSLSNLLPEQFILSLKLRRLCRFVHVLCSCASRLMGRILLNKNKIH